VTRRYVLFETEERKKERMREKVSRSFLLNPYAYSTYTAYRFFVNT